MMDYRVIPVTEVPLPEAAALFTRAFTGYIAGHVEQTAASLAAMIARDNVDLNTSRMLLDGDQQVGIALMARSGRSSRVAAMGIVPERQGQGAGRWLLEHLQTEARTLGDRSMALEAFEQNTPAVKLYSRMGFTIVRRLYGYKGDPVRGEASDVLEIDTTEVGKRIAYEGADDLPWQVSGAAVLRLSAPFRAYRVGDAYAVIQPAPPRLILRALFVPMTARRQGQARRLLAALSRQYPDHQWFVPQLSPEEFDEFFTRLGWERSPLHQVQMVWIA
jgi:GNAT superfamily N-acetyltransferase